jgi:hypothetical protein
VYIKDFLKLLFVFYITIIISLYYLSLYIAALYSINICLARDLFSSLEADLGYMEGFVYSDIVREVYYDCPLVYYKYGVRAVLFVVLFLLRSICLYIF